MIMRNYRKKTYMGIASLLALMSCSDGNDIHTYTVGAEDNAIALSIGVDNSPLTPTPNLAKTRAAEGDIYIALTQGTKMRLRVEGKWGSNSLIKFTDCSADAATGYNTYNTISSYSPMLYWDDFGTADPSNTDGKNNGLAIYGVAVNGKTDNAPDVNYSTGESTTDQWGNHSSENSNLLPWSTEDNSNSTVLERDLIVSNNLSKATAETPGNLTFDEHKAIKSNSSEDNLKQSRLIFKHVLSKVTFNLTPGDGFNGNFNATPIVTLVSDKNDKAYCITEGNINIKQGKAIAGTTDNDKKVVKLKKIADGDNGKITESAVIYPGSPIGRESDNDIVAKINADGNIYYVYAKEIRAAIISKLGSENTDYTCKASYNYVFNVKVSKTKISVTATLTDWNVIEAEEVEPKITTRATVGDKGTNMSNQYDFYRKTNDNDYSKVSENEMFWPDHQTHYHFRGIYPQLTNEGTQPYQIAKVGENSDVQAIKVSNSAWNESAFPCNFMIGMPEIKEDEKMCGSDSHDPIDMIENGICAREEAINLNFRYMMSQVLVELTTTEGYDKVTLDANTKVEIIGGYKDGYVGLHSRNVEKYADSKESYKMTSVSDDSNVQKHDAIIPQSLDGVKFRITVTNTDNSTDIYEVDINTIKEKNTNTPITVWKAGEKYKYALKITKTDIHVVATITDWTEKDAESDIWL